MKSLFVTENKLQLKESTSSGSINIVSGGSFGKVTARLQEDSIRRMILNNPARTAPITKTAPSGPTLSIIYKPRKKRKGLLAWLCPETFDEEVVIRNRMMERESRTSVVVQHAYNEMHGFRNPPHTLYIFRQVERLFVTRKDEASIDVAGTEGAPYAEGPKYEVYEGDKDSNSDLGNRLCVLAEFMTPMATLDRCKRYPFIMAAFDHEGKKIFKLEGEPQSCGVPPNIQVQDNEIRFGEVYKGQSGGDTALVIHDSHGEPVFRVRLADKLSAAQGLGEYDVTAIKKNHLIARITPKRDEYGERVQPGIFKVKFTKELALELKVLVLVAGLIMDYHFFDKY